MTIADYFERIYVINLPDRTDRRRAIEKQLRRVGMPLAAGKIEIFHAIRPAESAGFPSIAVRGCVLSHFEILKLAQSQSLENVLIIEDDLAISGRFLTDEERIVEQLAAEEWGIVYLGHVEDLAGPVPTRLVGFSPRQRLLTTHFYGVNGSVIPQLVQFLTILQQRPPGHPLGGPMYPDGAISTFRRQNPDVRTLLACPNLGWQRSSASDLSPQWFDQVPVLRGVAGLARAAKERLMPGHALSDRWLPALNRIAPR